MKTKYTAIFQHVITAKDIKTIDGLNISEASQKDLSKFLPYGVDFSKSADLLGVAFDVAVANMFNKNGDGISSMGAVKMLPTLYHKPINIEHNRDTIIGHTLSASLTDRDFKKELIEEDVKNTIAPFNITVGGVLYKIVAKELGKLLMDIQQGKQTDFSVASSWEVGFDKYYAAVGSNKLSECKIIMEDDQVESYSKYMKTFGGKGYNDEGLPVNRLINPEGTIVFLGAGLTKYPAADVGPVYVYDYSEEQSNEDIEEENMNVKANDMEMELEVREEMMTPEEKIKEQEMEVQELMEKMKLAQTDLEKLEIEEELAEEKLKLDLMKKIYNESKNSNNEEVMAKNISHLKNNNVIALRSDINMTKEELAKLIEEAVKASVNSKEESFANTTARIADAIVESNKQFIAEKEAAESKAKEIEAKAKEQEEKIASLEAKITETSETLKQANEKLAEIEQEKLAAIATQKFNERMSILDEAFALEDADREIIAKQLSSLSSDEEFDGLKKNLEVLMSAKLKSKIQEAKASQEQKMQEALAEELKKRGLTDPLEAKHTEVKDDLPNNSAAASETQPTLREKFSKAFDKNKIKVII